MRTKIALFLIVAVFSATFLPLHSNLLLRTVDAVSTLPSDMPVVFVDPLDITAEVGESFTISARIFNISGDFYPTEEAWEEGEPLPPYEPVWWRYNYSLGYLYAFDLRLKWDPTVLEYVSHTVTVPVEDYPSNPMGVLHGPIIWAENSVDPGAGTYRLALSSQNPAVAFNARNANATAFTMTFSVKRQGRCDINFTNVDLVVDIVGLGFPFSMPLEIPHWVKNGVFRTGELLTRIESVQGGALIAGSLYDPVILGEDMMVSIAMKNDNETTADTFNLSIYDGTMLLNEWENEPLSPDSTRILNYTVDGPSIGVHTITAEVSVLHGGETRTDELSENVTVMDTPSLEISGPSSATTGTTVGFSASESVHNDPNGFIETYTWTLWAPNEPAPRDTRTGESVSFELPPQTEKIGNWTVMLVVADNFGITARPLIGSILQPTSELLRPATEPYRESALLEVVNPLVISILTPENRSYLTDGVPLVFTVNRPASWMGYSLDGQANTTITGNSTLPTLPDGPHYVVVYANDTAGNMGASNEVHFTVDARARNCGFRRRRLNR
ncbi:MAG: hypothetical protein WCC63_05940 [Candidatus Bathyarchaeia archaeon]